MNNNLCMSIALSLFISLCQVGSAANLVTNGKPLADIILGEKATDSERHAAKELQRVLKLMTGAEFQSFAVDKASSNNNQIIIGTPTTNTLIKANAKLVSLLSNKEFNGQEFAIQTTDGKIFLAGNGKIGALYATYEFLESLGVRWVWPGESGEFIPKRDTVKVSKLDIFSKPTFKQRGYRGRYSYDDGIWMGRNKLNMGHRNAAVRLKEHAHVIGFAKKWGGHSYGWITPPDCRQPGSLNQGIGGKLPREVHFEKHPEHFSLISGKRQLRQQCYSNPELQQVFIDWIKAFWKDYPETEILNLAPMDNPSHCQCSSCKKFARNPGTRMFKFTDIIIKAAEKEYPGKQYRTYAYSWYKGVPDCEVNKNLIVDYCMYDRCYKHLLDDKSCSLNKGALRNFTRWINKGVKTFSMYAYHYDAVKGVDVQYYMPMVHVIQDELKHLAKNNYIAFASEMGGPYKFSTENVWAANQIDVFVNARLQWDPNGDPKKILKDVCDTVFGPASKYMQDYHTMMWDAWVKDQQHVTGYFRGPAPVADFVTPEVIKKADVLFAQALKSLDNTDGEYGRERYIKHVKLTQDVYSAWRKDGQEKKKWRDISQGTMTHRVPILKSAPAGKVHYSEDFESFTVNKTPDNYDPNCITKSDSGKNKYISVKNGGGGRVYPNHTRFFSKMKAKKWVNYETSLKFRYQGTPNKLNLKIVTRSHGVKFLDNFRSYHVMVGGNGIEVKLRPREGSPVSVKNGKTSFSGIGLSALESNKWHSIRIRTVDNKIFVWLTPNGKEEALVNDVDLPAGGGQIAIMNSSQGIIDLDEIVIKDIPDPKNLK